MGNAGFFNVNLAMNGVLRGGRGNWVTVRLNFFLAKVTRNQWRGGSKFTPASNYIWAIDFGVGRGIDGGQSMGCVIKLGAKMFALSFGVKGLSVWNWRSNCGG